MVRSPPRPINVALGGPPAGPVSNCEARLRGLLSRPFRIPIPSYRGLRLSDRRLGVRRTGARRPLHDPEEPGALVLYWPPPLSCHDQLTALPDMQPVHVVVDSTCRLSGGWWYPVVSRGGERGAGRGDGGPDVRPE